MNTNILDIFGRGSNKWMLLSPFISATYLFYINKISFLYLFFAGIISILFLALMEVLSYVFLSRGIIKSPKDLFLNRLRINLPKNLRSGYIVLIFVITLVWFFNFLYTEWLLFKVNNFYSKSLFIVNILVILYLLLKLGWFNILENVMKDNNKH